MSDPRYDREIWGKIKSFYKSDWDVQRQKNQKEAYWCRPEGNNQELFQDPRQRVFARFMRSYLNTTWHKISLTEEQKNELFSGENIVETSVEKIKSFIVLKEKSEKKESKGLRNLLKFCEEVSLFIAELSFEKCDFNREQTKIFELFQDAVRKKFNEKEKKLPISRYEKIIYDKLPEPYQTIMRMQKIFPGFGIALACDFLKESHLCNIAKPDVHISHVFSLMDGIPYSMDLALVKRVSEFAAEVCPADPNNFCNTGAYNVDKIIWMICSDYDTDADKKKKMRKEDFLQKLAEFRETDKCPARPHRPLPVELT